MGNFTNSNLIELKDLRKLQKLQPTFKNQISSSLSLAKLTAYSPQKLLSLPGFSSYWAEALNVQLSPGSFHLNSPSSNKLSSLRVLGPVLHLSADNLTSLVPHQIRLLEASRCLFFSTPEYRALSTLTLGNLANPLLHPS